MTDGGLSSAGLARLHDVMAGHIGDATIPGLVAAVHRRGTVVVEALGHQAIGGPPVQPDTIFRIASMTKPIIAVAALALVEECRVRLEDPIDRWLPELADRRVLRSLDGPVDDTLPAVRPVTVLDLLTFRSGEGIVMAPPGTYPVQVAADALELGQGPPTPAVPPEPDEWIRRLGTLPLLHQPGTQWMYNTGADVLGVLLARVEGRSLGEVLHQRIFEPLGMVDTGFSVPAADLGRLATSYTTADGGGLEPYDLPTGQWSRPPAFPSGGGGLVSTAPDYLAFARMLLDHGRHPGGRILSRPSVDLMTTDHLTPAQKAASSFGDGFFDREGWGFGVSIATQRDGLGTTVGSYGWGGGLGTVWRNDPREDLATVLLTQVDYTSPHLPEAASDLATAAAAAIDD